MDEKIEKIKFKDLTSRLKEEKGNNCRAANLEFKRRIVENINVAENYFIGPYTEQLRIAIARTYFAEIYDEDSPVFYGVGENKYKGTCCDTLFFEALAAPFPGPDGRLHGWKKIELYTARNNATLFSYVRPIAFREVLRLVNKEHPKETLMEESDEIFAALAGCYDSPIKNIENEETISLAKKAFSMLNNKEQQYLREKIFENLSADEIFMRHIDEYHPRLENGQTKEDYIKNMSKESRSTRVSQNTGRIIEKLRKIYKKLENEGKS